MALHIKQINITSVNMEDNHKHSLIKPLTMAFRCCHTSRGYSFGYVNRPSIGFRSSMELIGTPFMYDELTDDYSATKHRLMNIDLMRHYLYIDEILYVMKYAMEKHDLVNYIYDLGLPFGAPSEIYEKLREVEREALINTELLVLVFHKGNVEVGSNSVKEVAGFKFGGRRYLLEEVLI